MNVKSILNAIASSLAGMLRCPALPNAAVLWIAVPALLVSCMTDLRPIPENSSAPRTLVVEHAYTRHRIATTSFPAGRYTAQFADSAGTYYASPTKIVSTAYGLLDGGFCVPLGNSSGISAYLVDDDYENDRHIPVKLVNGVLGLSYHFER